MLPRALKFAYVVIVMASAMIAFVALRGHDELATAGSSFVLQVNKPDAGASAAQVAAAVEAFAREQQINVGRLYDDPLDVSERTVFLSVGDASAASSSWLNHRYPEFSPEVDLRFRPYQEARTLTADGTYLVYGSRQQSQDLLAEFERLGYKTAWSQVPSVTGQLSGFGAGALSTFILAIALVVVVSVVSSVLLNAKFYGVQRLHGRSLTTMVAGDVRRSLVVAGVVVLAVNLLLGLPLHLYNDFHQVGRFLGLELAIAAALTALALIVQALTVILLQRSAILEAVSGRVNAGWAFAGSYVLRGWSLLLALTIVSSGLTALWTLDDARAAHRIWTATGEAYYLRVSAAIEYAKNAPDLDARIGEALRQADNRNEVSIAARYTLPESGRDLLVVNKRYLDQHDLRDATGAQVVPEASAQLFVPLRYGPQVAQIEQELPRWAAVALRGSAPKVSAEPIQDGQALMFSSNGTADRTPVLQDAVVLLVPAGSGIISADEYTTMATNGGILVQNPEQALRALTDAGVGDYILGVTPFAHDAAQQYRHARRDVELQAINVIIGAALLLFTAAAVAFVYCGRNAQSLFAKHLHGWGFVRMYWRILALETAIGGALLAWTWSASAAVVARSQVPTLPPLPMYVLDGAIWRPVLAGGVMVTALVLAVGAVRRLSPEKEIR